jgi:hypothetical protein
MNTAASNDPRIQDVRVTRDEIIAHLADGRVISVPLAWSWRLSRPRPNNARIFVSSGLAKESTGLMSTRTSVSKGCFMVSPRIARDRDQSAPMPSVSPNRRTSVSNRRAGSVAPKPVVVARAVDTQRSPAEGR